MSDDIIKSLQDCVDDFCPCPVCEKIKVAVVGATAEISHLRKALCLAVGELSTKDNFQRVPPDFILQRIMDEARNEDK